MTTDEMKLKNLVCTTGYEEQVSIPQEAFDGVGLLILRDLLADQFENTKLRDIFLAIFPWIRDGSVWSPWLLFKKLAEDPAKKDLVKAHGSLQHFLTVLVKIELLQLNDLGEKKEGFSLNPTVLQRFDMIQQVLNTPVFKERVESYYPHLFILTCTVARDLRRAFPEAIESRIFDLTRGLVDIAVKLSTTDLAERHTLTSPCSDCAYPSQEPTDEDEEDLPEDLGEEGLADISEPEENPPLISSNNSKQEDPPHQNPAEPVAGSPQTPSSAPKEDEWTLPTFEFHPNPVQKTEEDKTPTNPRPKVPPSKPNMVSSPKEAQKLSQGKEGGESATNPRPKGPPSSPDAGPPPKELLKVPSNSPKPSNSNAGTPPKEALKVPPNPPKPVTVPKVSGPPKGNSGGQDAQASTVKERSKQVEKGNVKKGGIKNDNPDLPMYKPSLLPQVRRYIYETEKGASMGDILAFFQGLGYSEMDIHDVVIRLINEGAIWQSNENGKYTRLD